MSSAGRVVILNGASSAGKTSIATRFQARRAERGECWIVIGIDDANAKLPAPWWQTPWHDGPLGDHGVRFEPCADGLVVTTGVVGRRLFAAYRRTVAAWAHAGFDVVVDEVAFSEEAVADWHDALAGLAVTWIAIRCDAEVAAAREAARGDRNAGLARGLSAIVHEHAPYDFELDTTSASVDDAVAGLEAVLGS